MTAAVEPPSSWDESLRSAVSADFAAARLARKLALVAVLGWLAYEWGAGNETFTPWVLAKVISHTHGSIAIPLTAAIGFSFTTWQQLASGFTALAGFSIFDRTAAAAWLRLNGKTKVIPGEWSQLSIARRSAIVFGLGTTAVALIQIMATGKVGVRRHAPVVVQSAFLCGSIVGFIGGSVATIAVIGRNVEALSGTTDWLIRILGNPLFWIGLLLSGIAFNVLRRR